MEKGDGPKKRFSSQVKLDEVGAEEERAPGLELGLSWQTPNPGPHDPHVLARPG